MAIGRPVISRFVAGIPEPVLPGANGWSVRAGDIEVLPRNALEELNTMGQQAREARRGRHHADSERSSQAGTAICHGAHRSHSNLVGLGHDHAVAP